MTGPIAHRYLIALGSNMRVAGIGNPRAVLDRAVTALDETGLEILAVSRIIASEPVGPSLRRYANAALVAEGPQGPEELLATLHAVEARFGRKRRGLDWSARPVDLDIVLWSGGCWHSPDLTIPHRHFRERSFVLRPAAEVAPKWRDPVSGFTLRQLAARAA